MKRALIHSEEPGRICDIVEPGSEFEVHPNFSWIDVPDDTTNADRYNVDTGEIIKYNILEDPVFVEHGYAVARGIAYGSLGDQLDMIYKEIQATGTISADGPWSTHIQSVKASIPKDDPAAVLAWNIEYSQRMNGNTSPQ
jgi:hypothetical protein